MAISQETIYIDEQRFSQGEWREWLRHGLSYTEGINDRTELLKRGQEIVDSVRGKFPMHRYRLVLEDRLDQQRPPLPESHRVGFGGIRSWLHTD